MRLYGLGFRSFSANGWNLFDVLTVTGSFATTIPLRLGSGGFAIEQLQKLFFGHNRIQTRSKVKQNEPVIQNFEVSIQISEVVHGPTLRNRSSIPDILNLLGLWFTLFLFFGILALEVFGLTRWENSETHEQNFSSLGRSLLMLAFTSTGYAVPLFLLEVD